MPAMTSPASSAGRATARRWTLADLSDARPDPLLRRQVLGWLWNRYLVHGSYTAPPPDLPAVLERQLTLLTTAGPDAGAPSAGQST